MYQLPPENNQDTRQLGATTLGIYKCGDEFGGKTNWLDHCRLEMPNCPFTDSNPGPGSNENSKPRDSNPGPAGWEGGAVTTAPREPEPNAGRSRCAWYDESL